MKKFRLTSSTTKTIIDPLKLSGELQLPLIIVNYVLQDLNDKGLIKPLVMRMGNGLSSVSLLSSGVVCAKNWRVRNIANLLPRRLLEMLRQRQTLALSTTSRSRRHRAGRVAQ